MLSTIPSTLDTHYQLPVLPPSEVHMDYNSMYSEPNLVERGEDTSGSFSAPAWNDAPFVDPPTDWTANASPSIDRSGAASPIDWDAVNAFIAFEPPSPDAASTDPQPTNTLPRNCPPLRKSRWPTTDSHWCGAPIPFAAAQQQFHTSGNPQQQQMFPNVDAHTPGYPASIQPSSEFVNSLQQFQFQPVPSQGYPTPISNQPMYPSGHRKCKDTLAPRTT
ncbi:hypothetical protein BDZ89DRAFT_1156223 [Hymenopellis radicata]|nr:hypothetical protein BDZ89DRAFT_1156223 [Hymenopellis radicata]